MQLSVTFKNLESSQFFKSYLQEKLDRFDKYLQNPGTADVVLRSEKLRRIAEINLAVDRFDIHAKEENTDMQAAIDIALDRAKKQLVKNKEKIQEHREGRGEDPFRDLEAT
jgi:putative sigma-54 modulation protein